MSRLFTRSILLLFLFPACCVAQQGLPFVINVAGGFASSGTTRFDWSIGELCLVDSYNKPNVILENGFLHPGTERPGGNSNNFFARGDIMIFPNPANSFTEINFTVPQAGVVNMKVLDVLGKEILSKQFNYNGVGLIERLDVQRYPSGTYFIHLLLTPADATQPQRKGVFKLTHIVR